MITNKVVLPENCDLIFLFAVDTGKIYFNKLFYNACSGVGLINQWCLACGLLVCDKYYMAWEF